VADPVRCRSGLSANATALEEVGLETNFTSPTSFFKTLPALLPKRPPRTSINQWAQTSACRDEHGRGAAASFEGGTKQRTRMNLFLVDFVGTTIHVGNAR